MQSTIKKEFTMGMCWFCPQVGFVMSGNATEEPVIPQPWGFMFGVLHCGTTVFHPCWSQGGWGVLGRAGRCPVVHLKSISSK